jgi:glycosyltransferase involved in cell wall biosynthesis
MDVGRRPLISVVTPCFNEADNVEDCAGAVREVFERDLAGYDFEHIFCDNASTDATASRLAEIAGRDGRVKIILNARNFGPFRSMFNGLMSTRGDAAVVMLPADLQDPPEVIPRMVALWIAGNEVVQGVRKNREEGLAMRAARRGYYRLVRRFANIDIPEDVGEFQLVDRVIVETLRKYEDHYPYIRGMIASCGFRRATLEYTWRARRRGISKNRLGHLVDQALNGLISFTNVPLRLCMGFGLLVSAGSMVFALLSLAMNLIASGRLAAPGIPTLIVAVFFFAGLQMFFFGVLGEYIASIHSQVRKRPLVIEKGRINFEDGPGGSTNASRWGVVPPPHLSSSISGRRVAAGRQSPVVDAGAVPLPKSEEAGDGDSE